MIFAVIIYWSQFLGPRTRAFRTHASEADVWFGQGKLILWNPSETFVFLKNKKVCGVGSESGGMKTIFPVRGEEAVGPIQLRTELVPWKNPVLTREAQVLTVELGIWWKIADVGRYYFQISGVHDQVEAMGGTRGAYQIHESAVEWVKALTEAGFRSHINQLSMADVISPFASRYLQVSPGMDTSSGGNSTAGFEHLVVGVLDNLRGKALTYGIDIERLEVRHVELPEDIQRAINETRQAFLAPIRSEREAEARKIALEKLASVLGKDTVGLNELLKNFQGSNFAYLPPFMTNLFGMVDKKTSDATLPESRPALRAEENNGPAKPSDSIQLSQGELCAKCDRALGKGQVFCPSCGTPFSPGGGSHAST
jgi:regulator of protease activity HflC (stomatin/prohibitin superfamily)